MDLNDYSIKYHYKTYCRNHTILGFLDGISLFGAEIGKFYVGPDGAMLEEITWDYFFNNFYGKYTLNISDIFKGD